MPRLSLRPATSFLRAASPLLCANLFRVAARIFFPFFITSYVPCLKIFLFCLQVLQGTIHLLFLPPGFGFSSSIGIFLLFLYPAQRPRDSYPVDDRCTYSWPFLLTYVDQTVEPTVGMMARAFRGVRSPSRSSLTREPPLAGSAGGVASRLLPKKLPKIFYSLFSRFPFRSPSIPAALPMPRLLDQC